jgi:hypothetical protein
LGFAAELAEGLPPMWRNNGRKIRATPVVVVTWEYFAGGSPAMLRLSIWFSRFLIERAGRGEEDLSLACR